MRVLGSSSSVAAATCLLALAAVPLVVRADTVTLDNGRTLEGHVIDAGDSIILELAQGTVKLAKSRVKSITSKVTPQDEFRRQFAEIQAALEKHESEAADAAERFFALAEWAGEQGLSRGRAEALKRTLDLNPAHAGAREACGFVLQDGRWLTKAERNQELGFVLLEGQWVAPEAAREAQKAKETARQKQREVERAEAQKRLKEAEAEKLDAERDLADARRERLEDSRPLWWGYNRTGLAPWFWSGPAVGWPNNYAVAPYSYLQSPYVLGPTLPGRSGVNNPSANTPSPYGPQLRTLDQNNSPRPPTTGMGTAANPNKDPNGPYGPQLEH